MQLMMPPLPYRKARLLEYSLSSRLEDATFGEIVDECVQKVIDWQSAENPVIRRNFRDLSHALSEEELTQVIKLFLGRYAGVTPLLSEDGEFAIEGGQDEEYDIDDWIEEYVPFVDMGKDLGTAIENEGWFDWWYDWAGEIDDDFFLWVEELDVGDVPQSYDPAGLGDFNVPSCPAGGAYA